MIRRFHRTGIIPRGPSWLLWIIAFLIPSRRTVTLEMPDVGEMEVDLSDRGQAGYFLHGCLPRERVEAAIFKAGARDFRVIFDIGAHIGYYTRLFAKLSPDAAIHAFEPSDRLYPLLERNARGNPHLRINRSAVARRAGRSPFYQGRASDLSSTVRPVGRRNWVEAVSLDDYCRKNGVSRVDLIKCDVEGGELEVLLGARTLLASGTPPLWLIENEARFRKEVGYHEKELAGVFRAHSLQPVRFWGTALQRGALRFVECDPEGVSWEEVGPNVWVVPEHWDPVFRLWMNAVRLLPEGTRYG